MIRSCLECHGENLEGDREISFYMAEVVGLRFKHMQDVEIDALYNYFDQR